MKKYKILRFYQNSRTPARVITQGLSLEEAKAHCSDPETSSSTCKSEKGLEHTREFGPWFDGYDEEDE